MKAHSEKFIQRRRFLMVLPLLVLPFVTMIFWALGGGKGSAAQAKSIEPYGLNVTLPDAHFEKKEIWDKLSLYEIAERDSAKFEEARESDPYFDLISFKTQQEPSKKTEPDKKDNLIKAFPQKEKAITDPNEEKVNQKLQELYREISKADQQQPAESLEGASTKVNTDPQFTSDVDRLESMMESMHDGNEPDPEMQQIESVLEKILDIQHPERVKEKIKANDQRRKTNTLPVEIQTNDNSISIMQASSLPITFDSLAFLQSIVEASKVNNAFYGLDDEQPIEQVVENAIEAVIHDNQELVEGSTVKMRLLKEIRIANKVIPKDQFIYGSCAINDERLTIKINSIRTGNSLLPVSLSIYDMDGMEGIYIPGAITRDAAKQASDNALQNIQLMSLDPTIGAQAATAGIEAAKGLLSKKAKMIKVTVKAGYHILLRDTNTNQSQ